MTDVTNALKAGEVDPERAHQIVCDFAQQLRDEGELGFGDLPDDFGTVPQSDTAASLKDLLKDLPDLPSRAKWRKGHKSEPAARTPSEESRKRASPKAGRSRGGGGRTGGGSSSVRPVAGHVAAFVSAVRNVGLKQALTEAGIRTEGLPADKIVIAIVDVLVAAPNSLIDAELRDALASVLDEICRGATTFDQAEAAFVNSAYDLAGVIGRLFECYIMERFKTFFSEHESLKFGFDAADKVLRQARDYVSSSLELEKVGGKDLTRVEWGGVEGAEIIDAILENTIAVFLP